MLKRSLVVMLLIATSLEVRAGEVVRLDRFVCASAQIPAPWQVVQLDKKIAPTRYQLKFWDGVLAIEANAERSMALLARPVEIDLNRTPVLCWRWRVDASLVKADMASKAGDDYAARVYLSFALPPEEMGFVLRSQLKLARAIWGDAVPDAAINYVWDNRYPVGTRKPNAYTERTRMIVAESGNDNAGRWVVARHDVQQDVITEFGSPLARMIQISVASDTDNTGETARAGFADFHFVEKNMRCFAE
ncbi:DUF3047 domain-containing protein [Gallionella capsiferriformans]|uniref:DUF3047 domain-containing protein n=1 Tax=Gallionella capsiferriformans (strain ES-2) TaxID=395494 RepID=D9SHC3_GALCS|nr:DUF3047 domain-containing protein [Gallionella capsiferriformans]ADL55920.1 Protein of unknown function DUF3047 [Gallionella capsiferriformans ES-2]